MSKGAVEGSEKKPRRSTATKRAASTTPRKRATKTTAQGVRKKATTKRATKTRKTSTRPSSAEKSRTSTTPQQDAVAIHQATSPSPTTTPTKSTDDAAPHRRAPTTHLKPKISVWAQIPYSLYATTGTALVLFGVGIGVGISDPGEISVRAVTDQYNQQVTSQQREDGASEQVVPVQDSETRVNQPRLRPSSRTPAATPAASTESDTDVATTTATTTDSGTSEAADTADEEVIPEPIDTSTEEVASGEEAESVADED